MKFCRRGVRIATASVRTGFAMTLLFHVIPRKLPQRRRRQKGRKSPVGDKQKGLSSPKSASKTKGKLLLLADQHIDGSGDLEAQLGLDLEAAEGLDGLRQHQLLAVQLHIVLGLQLLGDLLGGDGTEELAADVDEKLFEKLRTLRTKVAQRAGVPPYVVFSNATLADMAARQPKSEYELLGVRGVGEAKARRYGAEFVDCIRDYLEAK